MKYLITGATGALGRAMVKLLSDQASDVRVFVRDKTRFRKRFPDLPAQVVTGDLLDPVAVKQAVEDVYFVFHCAAFPLKKYDLTPKALRVLLRAARPYGCQVIYPGNTWTFGFSTRGQLISPDSPITPTSAIARLKAEADRLVLGAGERYGTPGTVLHFPDFYGPWVINELVGPFFENVLIGKDSHFFGPINIPHEFIFIKDAARAMLAVTGHKLAFNRRYTVSGQGPITVQDFGRLIYDIAGTKGKVHATAPWMAIPPRQTSKAPAIFGSPMLKT